MMHHFWPFLVVAIMLVVLARIAMAMLGGRGGAQLAAPVARPAELPDAALRDEVRDLRERVRVLERIVTDDRQPRRLAAEIERLRGK